MVIGCPGSGKSHFSRILHKKTKLPLYHLDMMYWRADRTTVGTDEFRARLQKVLAEDAWIIDGNYASTMELRLAACDTVILLDYPTEICLDGIRERRGKPRDDMPWVETDEDAELVDLVKGYSKDQRPNVLALLEKFCNKEVIVFKNRMEAAAFLVRL